MRRQIKYDSCLVICHGKSELIFIKNIKSNLRLKFGIYAKDNGDSSIQITGLNKLLNNSDFKNLKALERKYTLDINKREIKNFKVFIIMDFDELEYTKEIKDNYLNCSMFKNHFLHDYIIPIYNDKNFDEVMIDAGFEINPSCKVKSYNKVFPGNNGDYDNFRSIKNKLQISKKSNIKLLLEYLDKSYKN